MTRTAATLIGFALVALSIGFNTMRYRVVWEMASPAPANESAQAAAASPPEKAESLAPAPAPASQAEAKPNPEPADRIAADRTTSAETNPSGYADSATATGSLSGSEAQRPLVPITRRGETELAAGVRRLPPVDQANRVRMDGGAGGVFGGSIPAYPRTGI
jgi:hypothetical protein